MELQSECLELNFGGKDSQNTNDMSILWYTVTKNFLDTY